MLLPRFLLRQRHAPELRALLLALVLAAAAVVAVSATADRVRLGLVRDGGALLGGDLALYSDHPLAPAILRDAAARGLATAGAQQFPTMLLAGGRSRLVDLKAVSAAIPLRGSVRLMEAQTRRNPARGTIWMDRALAGVLGVHVGDSVRLGRARLVIAGLIARDPDVVSGFFRAAPRVMMSAGDLPATGLVTPGSRVTYRLVVAGEGARVEAFRAATTPKLERGQRLESAREARPEIAAALDRAERYLGLAALLTVVLAAVAAVLAGHRYAVAARHAAAVMRALGAARWRVVGVHAASVLLVALAGGGVGAIAGFLLALVAGNVLGGWAGTELPLPALGTLSHGFLASLVATAGFALPPLSRLARGTVLEELQLRAPSAGRGELAAYLAGIAALWGLVAWRATSLVLAAWLVAATLATGVLAILLARLLSGVVARLLSGAGAAARHAGLSLVRRRGSPAEAAAIAAGIAALLVLTLVKDTLFDAWRASVPPDAPNRFVINIQKEQRGEILRLFSDAGLPAPEMFPMVRGRLMTINGKAVFAAQYSDPQTRRLVDREFNLAPAVRLAPDNRVVAGRFWDAAGTGGPQFSVEEGIAHRLGIQVGDVLGFEAGGRSLKARVTSVRKVAWDTFRVNFFVVSTPGVLEGLPANWITGFHLPEPAEAFGDRLVERLPNLTVIDVTAVLAEVSGLVDRGIAAASGVFWLTLGAGLAVLYTALAASRDERAREIAIWRTLGASRRILAARQWTEFALLGAVAGAVAATGASFAGWVLATRVFDVRWSFDWRLAVAGPILGAIGVGLAGIVGLRTVVGRPSLSSLRATE